MQGNSARSLLKKTAQISSLTLVSRCLGIVREMLTVRYLGAGIISDAFFTAFKIPNSLRKMFAEGALSVAFIPKIVRIVRERGKGEASSLMTLAFILIEGIVLALCAIAMWHAPTVVSYIAPGWSADQVAVAVPFLRFLMPFIFFVSSSALLAGAMQSVDHFFVPAFGPVLLNIVFISGLIVCMAFSLPVTYLCVIILFGGFLKFLAHVAVYLRLQFSFGAITRQAWHDFASVIGKFIMCVVPLCFTEVMLFISTSFASYLPAGSISLLYYANRFMGIPQGVFATAFATILLPHFSRVASYAPQRMSFYLLETTKFVFWVTVPASLLMMLLSKTIFLTIFFSDKFTMAQVIEASTILTAYVAGLFFLSLYRILPNIFYALQITWIPAVVTMVAMTINVYLDLFLMARLQAVGLACAASITAVVQVLMLVGALYLLGLRMYIRNFATFALRYVFQLISFGAIFWLLYRCMDTAIHQLPSTLVPFFATGMGIWLWVGPLCGLFFGCLYVTRKLFGIKAYFLE